MPPYGLMAFALVLAGGLAILLSAYANYSGGG